MSVSLTIALSLGILAHAIALPIFAIWIFFGGPEKRWQTGTATLAAMAGIFAYLIALTDSPLSAYVALGAMRGLFEVQRGLFLRLFLAQVMAVFGLVFVTNSLGSYTYNLSTAPVIVSMASAVVFYIFAMALHFLLRRMQGTKSVYSLGFGYLYATIVLITFALSHAMFDVISHSLEFFIYVFADIILLILPAVWHGLAYFYRDPEVMPFDFISVRQGLLDEAVEIEFDSFKPESEFRQNYSGNGSPYAVKELPEDDLAYYNSSGWKTPNFLDNI